MDNVGGTSSYHHVVLSDNASYPTNATPTTVAGDRTCLMCHGDHNLFSALLGGGNLRGRNLRKTIASAPSVNTDLSNTDFDNSVQSGVCTTCHASLQTKHSAIKSDGTTSTPRVIVSGYTGSAHNYSGTATESTFGSDSS